MKQRRPGQRQVRVFRAAAGAVGGLLSLGGLCQSVPSRASAATYLWTGAAGDNSWDDAGNWDPNGNPGGSDDVVLAGVVGLSVTGNVYTMLNAGTIDFATYDLNSPTIEGPSLINTGSINITGRLTTGSTTISGGGTINLNGGTLASTGDVLLNQDNLISGWGSVNTSTFENQATVTANVPGQSIYLSYTVENSGTLLAVNGGGISILGNWNSAGGTILATGSGSSVTIQGGGEPNNGGALSAGPGGLLTLNSTSMTGGSITSAAGGTIQLLGVSVAAPISNAGTLIIADVLYADDQINYLQGTVTNTGLIDASAGNGYLSVPDGQTLTLTGGGSFVMAGGSTVNAQSQGTMINRDNLIHGSGTITGGFINYGIVSADTGGNTLYFLNEFGWGVGTFNYGTLEAQSGGTLVVGSGVNSVGGTVVATGAGSTVELWGATIGGGTFNTASGGTINVSNINYFQGTINNSGVLAVLDTTAYQPPGSIVAPSGQTATLAGGGQILLTGGSLNYANGNPVGTLINQDNLIHGYGTIANGLINNATVSADSPGNTLDVTGTYAPVVNAGTMQALAGGVLWITGSLNNSGGTIAAVGSGSTVTLAGCTLAGGSLNTGSGGVISLINTNYLQGTITNLGALTVSGPPTTGVLSVPSGQTATLTGAGGVVLEGGSLNYPDPYPAGTLVNLNNLIHGSGVIYGGLTNNAVVSADSPGNTLYIETSGGPILNQGTLEAVDGGALEIDAAVNNAGGSIVASGSGSNVALSNVTITGGVFNTSGGGTITIAGINHLEGQISNIGVITVPGPEYVNSLAVAAGQTVFLSGGGQFLLEGGSLNDGGRGGPLGTLVNQDNLIHGYGLIYGGLSNKGTVSADSPGNTLAINNGYGPLSNTGIYEAQNGGSLQISSPLNNAGGTISANGAGSVVVIDGATIVGGTLAASAGGAIQLVDSENIQGVSVVEIDSHSSLTVLSDTLAIGNGSTLTCYGSLTGSPPVIDDGTIRFGANSGTGILVRSLGSVALGNAARLSVDNVANGSARTLLVTTTLGLSGTTGNWTALVDIGNNDIDAAYATLGQVTSQVEQGYNNGSWQGSGGIVSSAAAADTSHLTALGVIQNNQSGSTLFTAANPFDGITPGVGDILVKYTYFGDANLDGIVDGSDYSLIDAGYASGGGLTGWYHGDFNYDGVIDGSDYALIDNAFNNQTADLSTGALVAGATDQAAGGAAVPEPAVSLLLAPLLLTRRRRRRAARS